MFIPFGRLFRLLRRKPRPSPFGLDAWQDEEESQEVMVDQEMSLVTEIPLAAGGSPDGSPRPWRPSSLRARSSKANPTNTV